MPIPRPRSFRVPLSDIELAELHALSGHHRTDAATLVRQWVAREYKAIFGTQKPPAVAPLQRMGKRKAAKRPARR